jgi:hypothetical protein
MKRRAFIEFATTAGAVAAIAPTMAADAPNSLAALATPQIPGLARDHPLVHELGTRYRALAPAEDTRESLLQALLVEAGRAESSLDARIRARVQQDFTLGRTVTLNGWILAITEARQCALFSLLAL